MKPHTYHIFCDIIMAKNKEIDFLLTFLPKMDKKEQEKWCIALRSVLLPFNCILNLFLCFRYAEIISGSCER